MRISIKTRFLLIVTLVFAFVYQTYIRNYEVTIAGYINQADSIGRQSMDLYRMLKDDVEVNFHHVRASENRDLSLGELMAVNNTNLSLGRFILLEAGLPNSYGDFETYLAKRLYTDDSWNKIHKEQQIFAAYSMFESTRISPDRVRMINDRLDMVVVPDKAVEKAYLESGVTKPIFVVPLPIDYTRFAQYPLKLKPNKPFIFMNLSSAQERKNIPKLVEAFALIFANNPEVKLEIFNSREFKTV
jgi:glycosyltransferase involved in cell wall biosynthesis